MEDEQIEETGAGDDAGETTTKADPHRERLLADLKRTKARERETLARLADFEAKEREAAEAAERAAGDWAKLSARKDKELEAERAEKAQALAKLEAIEKHGRRVAFVEAIVGEAKGGNPKTIAALLPTLGLEDDAPEAPAAADIKAAIKLLQSQHPEVLAVAGASSPKPPPGGKRPPDTNDPDYWRQRAAAHSQGGMPVGYAAATGRK